MRRAQLPQIEARRLRVSAELKLGWESSGRGLKAVDTKTVAFYIPCFLKV